MDREIIAAALEAAKAGARDRAGGGLASAPGGAKEAAALVTVVDVKGSAPRHPGAKMLVYGSGRILGTIGGGKGEAMAMAAGAEAARTGISSFLEVEMLGADAEGKDLICGGVNRMLVEYLDDPAPYAATLEALDRGRRVLLRKRLGAAAPARTGGPRAGGQQAAAANAVAQPATGDPATPAGLPPASGFSGGDRLSVSIEVATEGSALGAAEAKALAKGAAILDEAGDLFLDPVLPEEKLLIVGGGHVGLALARAALPLGYKVTVVDDRADFLGPERFGPEVACVKGGYMESIDRFAFDEASYAVILTRGHLFDLESSRAVLKRPFRYAGLIGSSRKISMIREQLARDGYGQDRIDALHAPIGLSIGAETPEEIAVSILAEMIACRRNVKASYFNQ